MSAISKVLHSCSSALSHVPEPLFAWRLVFQRDERFLPPEERAALEQRIAELGAAMGVTKKIHLLERHSMGSAAAQAQGATRIPGRVGIAINADYFSRITDDARDFILAHEIGHIKQNWLPLELAIGIAIPVVLTVAAVALAVLCPLTIPGIVLSVVLVVGAMAVGFPGMMGSQILFSKRNEKRADRAAFEGCSKRVVEAEIESLIRERRYLREKRKAVGKSLPVRLWRKISISSRGDDRLDMMHPSLSSQIRYLSAWNASGG